MLLFCSVNMFQMQARDSILAKMADWVRLLTWL